MILFFVVAYLLIGFGLGILFNVLDGNRDADGPLMAASVFGWPLFLIAGLIVALCIVIKRAADLCLSRL